MKYLLIVFLISTLFTLSLNVQTLDDLEQLLQETNGFYLDEADALWKKPRRRAKKPKKCTCNYILPPKPVCGEDGVTYPGACEAQCAGVEVAHEGKCDCVCNKMYKPVCGADGVTYGNACAANCAGVQVAHEGECGCVCNKMYKPVCGTDGVTYGNACAAGCAGVGVAYDGVCK
jgi:hypothetical protein